MLVLQLPSWIASPPLDTPHGWHGWFKKYSLSFMEVASLRWAKSLPQHVGLLPKLPLETGSNVTMETCIFILLEQISSEKLSLGHLGRHICHFLGFLGAMVKAGSRNSSKGGCIPGGCFSWISWIARFATPLFMQNVSKCIMYVHNAHIFWCLWFLTRWTNTSYPKLIRTLIIWYLSFMIIYIHSTKGSLHSHQPCCQEGPCSTWKTKTVR